ncbi:MAG: hypothetical protein KatS3mg129_2362 [Leptospiraceae bacterium]|nr:MAG: hypothetical protein KatS3mg129_2362 [Leptospiraceae bacterium]
MKLKIFIIIVLLFLFHCLKFKENPLDPTTPLGYYLTYILNKDQNKDSSNDSSASSYVLDKIIMFKTSSTYDGDLDTNNDGNARPEIDAICATEFNTIKSTYPGNYEYMQHIRAFISINSTDQIANFPSLYGVPTNVPILGPDPSNPYRLIANDWNDLWTEDSGGIYIKNSLNDAIGLSFSWWSGSYADGTLNSDNCQNWSNNSNSYNGAIGEPSSTNAYWINYSTSNSCDSLSNLLCIAW